MLWLRVTEHNWNQFSGLNPAELASTNRDLEGRLKPCTRLALYVQGDGVFAYSSFEPHVLDVCDGADANQTIFSPVHSQRWGAGDSDPRSNAEKRKGEWSHEIIAAEVNMAPVPYPMGDEGENDEQ